MIGLWQNLAKKPKIHNNLKFSQNDFILNMYDPYTPP